jgi:hypothetical protein
MNRDRRGMLIRALMFARRALEEVEQAYADEAASALADANELDELRSLRDQLEAAVGLLEALSASPNPAKPPEQA